MTVSVQQTVFPHTGNGVTVTFGFACQVLRQEDLHVAIDGDDVTSGFTVSGIGDPEGGAVTFSTPPGNGASVLIERIISLDRPTDYQQNGDFRTPVVNKDFDRVWMALQQFESALGLAPGSTARALMLGRGELNGSGAYRASNNRIKDVADAVDMGDAVNLKTLLERVAQFVTDGSGVAVLQLLAGLNGASRLGFAQAETGAVLATVQDKLRQIASRADYSSDAEFNEAKGDRPSIDGTNNFDALITPAGSAQGLISAIIGAIKSEQSVLTAAANATHAGRFVVTYRGANSVYLRGGKYVTMSGFRFHGQWTKTGRKVVQLPAQMVGAVAADFGSVASNLGAGMTSQTFENWYAVFAVCADGDTTATLKVMPYLRARTVASNVVTLNKAGEGVHSAVAQTYAWANNALAGTDCLVISETIDGRFNSFSGRVTTITANTNGQVTLASAGNIAALDWLLPAPPGYTNYRYLGSFYIDTAEVRNIADSGTLVKSYGISITSPSVAASVATPTRIEVGGYICPLATSVSLYTSSNFSTSTTGAYAEYFAMDGGNHNTHELYYEKETTANGVVVRDDIASPFSFGQQFYFSNAGNLAALRTGQQIRPRGWIEP